MKAARARRAAHSLARRVGRSRKLWLVAACVLPVVVITPAIAYFVAPASPGDLELAIRKAGFDPLLPPNRLRGPGALYEVEDGYYRKVCDVDPDLLQGRIHKSPIESQIRERLESSGFSLAAKLVDAVNARLGGSRVTSIKYSLTDASIREISLSDLALIEDQLLRQKSCDETVQRLLKAHRKVCSGYAVLAATTSYKVNVATKYEASADAKAPILAAAQQALEENTQGTVQLTGSNELSGEDLFYGIQLSTLCITLDTATEPSVLAN